MVVLVHVMPEFGRSCQFLGCLRMPLYFCLSGLFYKDYGGVKSFVVKKTNKILIPFAAWYVIAYAVYYGGRFIISSETEMTYGITDVFVRNDIQNQPIWFLLCLFWSNVLFTVIVRLCGNMKFGLTGGVIVVTALGWGMMSFNVFNFLYVGSAMTCMPFFYMGYVLKRTSLLYPTKDKRKDALIMVLLLVLACMLAFIPDLPPRLSYYKNGIDSGNAATIYLCGACFVAGVLLMCKFVGKLPYVSYLGRYSIIVLVTHMQLQEITSRLVKGVLSSHLDTLAYEAVNFAIVVGLMAIIIPLCKRFLPYITAQKDFIEYVDGRILTPCKG